MKITSLEALKRMRGQTVVRQRKIMAIPGGFPLIVSDNADDPRAMPDLHFPYTVSDLRSVPLDSISSQDDRWSLSILYESDHQRSAAYAHSKAVIAKLRQLRRFKLKQLDPASYRALVQRFERLKSLRVWDGTFTLKHKLRRVPTYIRHEKVALTKREFIMLRLRSQRLSSSERERLLSALRFLKENPSEDLKRFVVADMSYRELVDLMTYSPGDFVSVPNMIRVQRTVHDWECIRRTWAARKASVQQEAAIIQDSIMDYVRKRNLASRTSMAVQLKSNTMLQFGCATMLPVTSTSFVPNFHDPVFHLTTTSSAWDVSPNTGVIQADGGIIVGNGSTTGYTNPKSTWGIRWAAEELPTTLHDVARVVDEIAVEPAATIPGWKTVLLPEVLAGAVVTKTTDTGNVHWEATEMPPPKRESIDGTSAPCVSRTLGTSDNSPTIVSLDALDGAVTHAKFDDKRRLLAKQLSALDLGKGSDALVFNATRSVGELKDTKQTYSTLKDFPSFMKASKGSSYYVLTGRKSVKYATESVLASELGISQKVMHRSSTGQIASKDVLKRLGLVSITKRRVTTATKLATLASLYLAWKFGVSQTLSDGQTVINNGLAWACQVRRGLSQLVTHLDLSKGSHPLRRMGRLCCGGIAAARRAKEDSYTESVEAKGRTLVQTDNVDWSDVIAYQLAHPDMTIPRANLIRYGAGTGLQYYLYALDSGPDKEEFLASVKRHNAMVLASTVLRQLAAGYRVYLRNDCRTVFYARYSTDTILKSLRTSVANAATLTKSLLTAWELAPLSFVTEWLVNERQLILEAQALLERTTAKLYPIGKMWEMASNRLWAGVAPISCELDLAVACSKPYLAAHKTLHDWSRGEYAGYSLVKGYASATCTYTFHTLEPSQVQMHKTDIRSAYRLPADENLNKLSPVRVQLSINAGKLGSLLAMVVGKK